VFIVEDDPSIQRLYKRILTKNRYEVAGIAKNGEEAVSMFKSFSEKPEVIIMDYRMPIKNGIEASKEILQINDNTKIIFASGDNSIKEKVLLNGVYCFLDKPFSIRQLITHIKRALE